MAGSHQLNPKEVMTIQLAVLRQEHRDLDLAISALVCTGTPTTGMRVLEATMPGKCAAPPAPAIITFKPRSAAFVP